jgi:WD40 repeat protein
VAEALAYAHAQGTLHRDIKPSNLLLDTHGIVWVTDFGLAKAADSDDLTHTGDLVGTLRYMAPERFAGQSEPRSDLYGLGLTLYELLTLRPAFEATDRNRLIAQVQHEEPPRPRKVSGAVPRDLETIVLKAMAKEPAHRYSSAAALAEDLRRFVEDKPIQARPVSGAERLWRWCRRNPVVATLTAAVAVLLVTVAVVSTVMALHIGAANTDLAEARDEAKHQAETARGHADKEKEERQKRETVLARLYVGNGAQALDRGDLFDSLPWFVEALKIEKDDPKRAEMHRIRLHTVLQQCPRVQLFFKDGPPKAVGFISQDNSGMVEASDRSTDGRRVVKVQNRDRSELLGAGTVGLPANPLGPGALLAAPVASRGTTARVHSEAQVWDLATGRAVTPPLKYDGLGGILRAFFSPDGRRVYTAGCRWITAEKRMEIEEQVWDAATGRSLTPPLKRAGGPAAGINHYSVMFSSNGKRVRSFVGTIEGDRSLIPYMWVWDATTSQLDWSLREPMGPWGNGAALSPDGNRLLFQARTGGPQLWDIAKGKPIGAPIETSGPPLNTFKSAFPFLPGWFSRDGRRILTRAEGLSNHHELRVWAADTGKPLSPSIRIEMKVASSGWNVPTVLSADGSRILAGHWQPGVPSEARIWDAATGLPITPRLPCEGQLNNVSLSPDGRQVLVANGDGRARLWDLAIAQYQGSSLKPGTPLSRAAFSPDGRRAVRGSGQGVQVWDTRTGRPAGPLLPLNPDKPQHPAYDSISHVAFSPDGRLILAVGSRRVTAERTPPRSVSEARVLDAVTGRPITPLLQPDGTISQHAFSRDNRRILLVVENATKPGVEVQVWDVGSGRLAWQPCKVGQWASAPGPLVSADLRYLVTASHVESEVTQARVRVVDTTTGVAIMPPLIIGGGWPPRMDFSADGRRLAALGVLPDKSSAYGVWIWDLTTAHPRTPLHRELEGDIIVVAFSPDGNRFVTASREATARVWNAATGVALTPPLRHGTDSPGGIDQAVYHAEFSPDGRRLLTATEKAVRGWDADTGEPLTPPLQPGGGMSAAAFFPEALLADPLPSWHTFSEEW